MGIPGFSRKRPCRLRCTAPQLGTAILFSLLAAPGHAEPFTPSGDPASAPHLNLVVDPNPCVDAARLEMEIQRRSKRIRLVKVASAAHRARVQVVSTSPKAGAPWRATLNLSSSNGSHLERQLEEASCRDLTSALGFVLAVTLDPPRRPKEDSSPTSAPEPAPELLSAPTSKETQEAPERSPLEAQSASTSPPTPQSPRDLDPEPTGSWSLGVGIGQELGPSPTAMWAGVFRIERQPFSPRVFDFPGVSLTLLHARSGQQGTLGGLAAFDLTAARLSLCPFRLGKAGARISLCGSGGVGILVSQGEGVQEPGSSARPWGEWGAGLHGQLDLGRHFQVGSMARMGVPLVRDRYQFAPVVFHETPSTTFSWDVTLGWRL